MRSWLISAALCGLALAPGVYSQTTTTAHVIWEDGKKVVCVDNDPQDGEVNAQCLNSEQFSSECGTSPGQCTKTETIVWTIDSSGKGSYSLYSTTSDLQATESMEKSGISLATITAGPSNDKEEGGAGGKNGALIGGVVGGVLGAALIAGILAFVLVRRRRKARERTNHTEAIAVIADKSRASSPTSHASPIYVGAAAAPLIPPPEQQHPVAAPYALQQQQQQETVAPPHPHPPQQQQHHHHFEPAELLSREVDEDGVSVNSLDLKRPAEERAVPRLPVYQRGSPPGGSTGAL